MDIRGCVFVVLLLVNCLFVTYISAAQIPQDELAGEYGIDEVSEGILYFIYTTCNILVLSLVDLDRAVVGKLATLCFCHIELG